MNKYMLFVGAGTLGIFGLVLNDKEKVDCGLVLMWIGISIK
jgi:hypothetical protein